MGSSASGSSRAASVRASCERRSSQLWIGSISRNTSGFRAMEISAPATTRLCASPGITRSAAPRLTRMKENSPICARLAETVSAVCSG
ncbi:hypothetical protein D9M68_885610 [compost metagenome]